jgi:Asp-tRNA(Asn)/Glu-tRNA(Gln) amidotransferase A subunit family amidase
MKRAMLEPLASAIRSRDVSSEEMIRATVARYETHNPALNAIVTTRFEQAIEEARTLDRRVLSGEETGPLAGLPLLVKDIDDVEGLRTSNGSLTSAVTPASSDALVVQRLKKAGAIVVGKTNTPEYSFEAYTSNRVFGSTPTPWGLQWSAGGSSGGSAAALAAGIAPIATGTDGGGSVRIPASLCGLVGHKPTNGLIGRWPIPSWIDLTTDGVMTTTAADAELLTRLLAGRVAGDITGVLSWEPSRKMPKRALVASRTYDWGPLPASVDDAFQRSISTLGAELHFQLEEVDMSRIYGTCNPDLDWFTIVCTEQAHHLGRAFLEAFAADLDPVFANYMNQGLGTSIEEYMTVRRRRFDYSRRLDELLGEDAILVTPTLATEGFQPDGRMSPDVQPGVNPEILNTVLQNITGHPAISVPAGCLDNGLPFGLQFTGPQFHDSMLFDVAAAWEAVDPWPLCAPAYEPFNLDSLGSNNI